MATCKRIRPMPNPPSQFELVLSQSEAQALRDLIANTSGCKGRTRFQYVSAIAKALDSVGIIFDENIDDIAGRTQFLTAGEA